MNQLIPKDDDHDGDVPVFEDPPYMPHGSLDWRTPLWKTQSGPNPLSDQKWTTGGDRGRNFEQKLWTKIS